MREEAKINFYKIYRCGYYQRGDEVRLFGGLENILLQLKNWVSEGNLSLEDTCTYSEEEDDNLLRTFCFNIISDKKTGDYLLTTWNETPSNKGRVAAVAGQTPVGKATVHLNRIPRGAIPGYATYFWILPQQNIFATVRFHHTLNGHKNLVRFFKGFLDFHSDHVVLDEDPDDDGNFDILGYTDNDGSEEIIEGAYPAFKSFRIKNPGEIDFIRHNRSEIKKIIRKNSLDLIDSDVNISLWQTMLEHLGLDDPEEPLEPVKIEYALPYTPNASEFEKIIGEWSQSNGEGWNDVGFKITGEPQPRWLSSSLAKVNKSVKIKRDNDEVVNSESLLETLIDNRDYFLKSIK